MPEYKLVRHRGTFSASWTENGQRYRRSLGTADKKLARARLDEFARKVNLHITGAPTTMEAMFDAYVADRSAAGTVAVQRIKDAWKRLKTAFTATMPESITDAQCREYLKARNDAGASTGTVHTELAYLRAALTYAKRMGWIEKAPLIRLPQKPRPKEHHLTRKEGAKFVKACVRPHARLFAILALTTAGRVSAILELTWDRVDLKARTVDLRVGDTDQPTKGRAKVPMNGTLFKALSEAQEAALTEYVVEYAAEPVASVKTAVKAAAKRAGLVVTPHVLRHTAAVWMAEDGVPIGQISQYLGHSNSSVTERVYAKFSPTYLRGAASSLEIDLD